MTDTRGASREALRQAAKFILSRIRAFAPTAVSAASFRANRRGEEYFITSNDDGTIATEINARHPLFAHGPRGTDGWLNWFNTNQRHPERTHFMEKAAEDAVQLAAEKFADAWAEGVVA